MEIKKKNGVFGGNPPIKTKSKKIGIFGKIFNKGSSAFKKAIGYSENKGINTLIE